MKKQALGKGLDAILGSRVADGPPSSAALAPVVGIRTNGGEGRPLLIPLEQVIAGRGQPRRRFDDEALDGLAESIRERGILQPLLVTERAGGYELIAGERRLRAAARAGLDEVPVIVHPEVAPGEDVELALIENVQREDLTPIEAARGYRRLVEQHGYTQEQVANRIGKSRVSVSNTMRLLALPEPVQGALDEGLLSEGHARALLGLPTAAAQIKLAQRAIRDRLSVRDTETLARAGGRKNADGTHTAGATQSRREHGAFEDRLARALGTKVRIRGTTRGTIEVSFFSGDDLVRLVENLAG